MAREFILALRLSDGERAEIEAKVQPPQTLSAFVRDAALARARRKPLPTPRSNDV